MVRAGCFDPLGSTHPVSTPCTGVSEAHESATRLRGWSDHFNRTLAVVYWDIHTRTLRQMFVCLYILSCGQHAGGLYFSVANAELYKCR